MRDLYSSIILFLLLVLVSCSSVHTSCDRSDLKCQSDHVLDNNPPELPGSFR